jgi:hypothetical protein
MEGCLGLIVVIVVLVIISYVLGAVGVLVSKGWNLAASVPITRILT